MQLLTAEHRAQLKANAPASLQEMENHNPVPVVKLFTPDGPLTWWLVWSYPDDEDRMFAVVENDAFGVVESGDVSFAEIAELRGALNLPVERDLYTRIDRPWAHYLKNGDN